MVTRAAKKTDANTDIIDPFDDIATSFRNALGDLGQGHVKIFVKRGRDTRHAYLSSEPIGDGDIDGFIEEVRKDYPEGGDFLFKLCNEQGHIKVTKQLMIAPLPAHERVKLDIPVANGNNDLMIAMMQMQNNAMQAQAQSSAQMMTMMMTLSGQNQQSTASMLAAIIPAIAGNKGESAGELLRNLTAAQKDLMPPPAPPTNTMMETLEMMKAFKDILPDGSGGGDSEGFGGLLKSAGPLLGGLLSAAQQPKAQQTVMAPPPQVQYAPQPQPQLQTVGDTPIAEPPIQPEETDPAMLAQMQLIQTYDPILKAIKKLLEKGADADRLFDYINDQIEAEVVTEDNFDMLLAGLEAQPDQLIVLLNFWGINAPEHINTVKQCLALFMETDDDSAGSGGDEANLDTNVATSD